jgi:hypothetical protein
VERRTEEEHRAIPCDVLMAEDRSAKVRRGASAHSPGDIAMLWALSVATEPVTRVFALVLLVPVA